MSVRSNLLAAAASLAIVSPAFAQEAEGADSEAGAASAPDGSYRR